jgi:hypothetical protein
MKISRIFAESPFKIELPFMAAADPQVRIEMLVKGGVKIDHWGGEKVDHFLGS